MYTRFYARPPHKGSHGVVEDLQGKKMRKTTKCTSQDETYSCGFFKIFPFFKLFDLPEVD